MSTGKRTPGPWQSAWDAPEEEVQPGENGEEWAIRAADGEVVVGTMYYDGLHMFVTPEDARFIVQACNSHDELLEALEDLLVLVEAGEPGTGYPHKAILRARAALGEKEGA